MRYLVVDGELHGTGIRDKYDREYGYINLKDLNLSKKLIIRINKWIKLYEKLHYNEYSDKDTVMLLDTEGYEIAVEVSKEIKDAKVEYYSGASNTIFLLHNT